LNSIDLAIDIGTVDIVEMGAVLKFQMKCVVISDEISNRAMGVAATFGYAILRTHVLT
jgi:hypothetical protein